MLSITQYKANQTLVQTTEYTALLSYGVPQVIVMHTNSALGNTVLHNNLRYSNTTSKHKKAFLRTLCGRNLTLLFLPHLRRFKRLQACKLKQAFN